jgi:hypothetical protein
MAFYFREQFGRHAEDARPIPTSDDDVRANIERLRVAGRARRDDKRKARVLAMLVLKPNGRPRLHEPKRIAGVLSVPVKAVRRLIEDFQRKVDYLVKHGRVSRAQAWVLIKKPSSWASVALGIRRSKSGRHAGSRPRNRSGY